MCLTCLTASSACIFRAGTYATMAFTNNSDVYGAIREDGINRGIDHLKHKRPSLLNYGTARVVAGAHT